MRVRFLTELEVTPLPSYDGGRRVWILDAPFICEVLADGLWRIVVPEKFETDFASVPRWPLLWLLAGGVAYKSPVLHDYLYRTGGGPGKWPRAKCDKAFLAGMVEEHIPTWQRRLMYWGVRLGGGRSYRANGDNITLGI